jgi:ferritin-like metal-binding protein YciE
MPAMPPQITSPRELVLADLGQLLTVEETLAKVAIPGLVRSVQDSELRDALEQHLGETEAHVDAIRRAFESLGETPQGRPAPALDGLREEQQQIADVALALRDSFATGAAIGAEHYEIAVYSSILPVAEHVLDAETMRALQRILEQEFAALRKLEAISERLAEPSS